MKDRQPVKKNNKDCKSVKAYFEAVKAGKSVVFPCHNCRFVDREGKCILQYEKPTETPVLV